MKPVLTFNFDSAMAYTLHKGRMPHDVHELRDWLREFAAWERTMAQNILNAYQDHMAVCNRPVIIARTCDDLDRLREMQDEEKLKRDGINHTGSQP